MIGLWYTDDKSVTGDEDLQRFYDELASVGQLRGVPNITRGVVPLREFCVTCIFTASALHAALNFSQIDYAGIVCN